jgi:hypothetical protein
VLDGNFTDDVGVTDVHIAASQLNGGNVTSCSAQTRAFFDDTDPTQGVLVVCFVCLICSTSPFRSPTTSAPTPTRSAPWRSERSSPTKGTPRRALSTEVSETTRGGFR